MMKVVVAGSRRLPVGTAPRVLLHFLLRLPPDAEILVRRAASGLLGPFEHDVETVADILGLHLSYRQPNTAETPGRASVFARDIEMVSESDLVVLLMDEEEAEGGYSGTFHLYEQALQQERPVYAWVIKDHEAKRWGEHDPADLFASLFE